MDMAMIFFMSKNLKKWVCYWLPGQANAAFDLMVAIKVNVKDFRGYTPRQGVYVS